MPRMSLKIQLQSIYLHQSDIYRKGLDMNLEEIEKLNEEELNEAKAKWTLDDWIEYYTKDGVMTLDEFRDYTIELVLRKLREKHGSDNQ